MMGFCEDSDDVCVKRIRISSRLMPCLSVAMVMMTLCYIWHGDNVEHSTNNANVLFLQLLSLAAQFGAHCWVTVVAGCSMVFNIRRLFDRLQSVLFLIYCGTTLTFACVTLVTYVRIYDYDSLTQTQSNQFSLLVVCVICSFINSCFFAPSIVDIILHIVDMEKDSGVAYNIGLCNTSELKKTPEYSRTFRKFIIFGSIAGVVNTLALIGNALYIYGLASHATDMNMIPGVLR